MKPVHLRSIVAVGAFALLPALASAAPAPKAPPTTWEQVWETSWQRADVYYPMRAATTAAADKSCQGDLGLPALVKATTVAIAAGKHGDAMRAMAQFQEKSMCLTREGARGLEFALAMFVHRAITKLPAAQAQIAVQGAFNLGELVFDELQFTGRSYWLPMVHFHNARIQTFLATYPKQDLGLWLYDFGRGAMVQTGGIDPLLASAVDMSKYADGSCTLLDMTRAGYACKGKPGAGGGSASGATGDMPGGAPPSGVACILDAAKNTGTRGMIGCMTRATAGMTVDPRAMSAAQLVATGAGSGQPGIRDPHCALSDEAAGTDTTTEKKEPTKWETVKDVASKAADVVVSVFMAVFDKTPPVISELGALASPEGAAAEKGAMEALKQKSALEQYGKDDDYEAYLKNSGKGRTVNDPGNPSGSCGRSSVAASRAKALYQCTNGKEAPRKPLGGANPLVSMPDPSQLQSPMTGAMSCLMQGGDQVRQKADDGRCAISRCAGPDTPCACNKGGLSKGDPPMVAKKLTAGPDCMGDAPCTTAPTTRGGSIKGPSTGPAPLPKFGGPMVGPKGPTPTPGGGPEPGVPPKH